MLSRAEQPINSSLSNLLVLTMSDDQETKTCPERGDAIQFNLNACFGYEGTAFGESGSEFVCGPGWESQSGGRGPVAPAAA